MRLYNIFLKFSVVRAVPTDLRVLFALRMVRLFACGLLAVVLVLHLNAVGLDQAQIGALLTLVFLGDAAISLALTVRADRWGRRRTLRVGAALMVLGGAGMALTDNFVLLLLAATIGVISPTGSEVGPFFAVEQACLSQVSSAKNRIRVFAWYHVAGFSLSAVGALVGGVVSHALQQQGWTAAGSYRVLLWIFAACGAALGLLSFRLSRQVEVTTSAPRPHLSANHDLFGLGDSRGLVVRLSTLFALDSFAGGFCLQSFVAYWFFQKFGISEEQLGALFFGSSLLAGLSGLVAVPLAKRFGLIHTMVWTHLPSNILLILVPLMPSLELAVTIFWLRNFISKMDMPTQSSYLSTVVPPAAWAGANGLTGTARQLGTAMAPLFAAPLLGSAALLSAPFFICGGGKILYDLLLWRSFRSVVAHEERRPSVPLTTQPRPAILAPNDWEKSPASV